MIIGTMVAWEMLDGNTMAGELRSTPAFKDGKVIVKRVDGTLCYADQTAIRVASFEDIDAALAFFENLGK